MGKREWERNKKEPKIEEVGPDGNPIVVEEMKSPEPKSMME